jgi:predicted DNA-binding transcriptional regulator YafY
MRRAERLFQIVQLVRGRRLTTAAFLAERLEISERSVYRDIADLQRQGVPIDGEAGVGYRFGFGFELPPLMFTIEEAKALLASVRMAQPWQDVRLAQAGELALSKILSVLSPDAKAAAQTLAVYAPPFGLEPAQQANLQFLRDATQLKQKLRIHYQNAQESPSDRVIWPLGCFY